MFPTSACGIVELWSRREGCRPDSGSRSRREEETAAMSVCCELDGV